MVDMPDDLRERLRQFGQDHVLAWWPTLNEGQRQSLLSQLREIDLEQLEELYRHRDHTWQLPPVETIQPVRPIDLSGQDKENRPEGEAALRRGEVAVLVVAGGQGSRLGVDQPKGMFPVGPVSGKTLFQIHAEKVLALRRRYQAAVPLLVMTSPATDRKSRDFFRANHFFGLPADEVHFFCQGTMPALDAATGKLLMAGPDSLSLSPNGHGGTLLALRESGLLDRLHGQGIRQLFYFQVDNPLILVGDPVFLGHHRRSRAELSLKVLPKHRPDDKMGNNVAVDGRCAIIEYFLLPQQLAEARDEHGRLRFGFGSPAIHIFDVEFLRRVLADRATLPFHAARKKVAHLDAAGQRVMPSKENAIKFEMFIFDCFPRAERWTTVLTQHDQEYAPLKNDSGPDSPETVRRALSARAAEWLRQAGAVLPHRAALPELEISPLFALDVYDLKGKIKPGQRIEGRTYLE